MVSQGSLGFFQEKTAVILLLALLIVSAFTYNDYGISWDEPTQRTIGKINYEYIFSDNKELLNYHNRDYGVAIEVPLYMIEKIFKFEDSRSVYFMRHLMTHLFFLLGAYFCFRLIDFLYKNKLLASIGFLLIVLHPLLYAHSFFNSKDVPFVSMFFICFYYSAYAFKNKSLINFLYLGLLLGILINIRIMGVLLFATVSFFLLIDFILSKKYLLHLKLFIALLFTSVLALVFTWPYLWEDPLNNFITAFERMSHFRWESRVLFMGEMVMSTNLPWSYAPVWFLITSPIFYSVLALFGIFLLTINFIKKPKLYLSNSLERNNLLFILCFIAPLIVVIVLKSVLYDSWRQLYFIYAGYVMLAVYGLNYLLQKRMNKIVIGSALLAFLPVVFFMIKNHPFQHVYFNALAGTHKEESIRKNYELDYWGTSFKQALEYILENDDSAIIKTTLYPNDPGARNLSILTEAQRQRIQISPIEEADYFVTNYRWHPADYPEYSENKYHKIMVGNNTIIEIFKLK